jgi:uncharacterized protein (DUF433 family)
MTGRVFRKAYNGAEERMMPKPTVVNTRLTLDQKTRLERKARQLGRSPSETSALLIEEGLRRDEFAFLDFRTSPAGRQAYIQGSTLAVWEVVWIARGYHNSVEKTASHLRLSPLKVRAALNYAAAFGDEINGAIAEHDASDLTTLSKALPQTEVFSVPK